MNKIFVHNIGDLAEAQRSSFYRFLSTGIVEELKHFQNPFFARAKISNRKKIPCLIYLYPNEIKLKGPNSTIDNCLKRDTSYTIQLYISAEYSYSINNFIEKEPSSLFDSQKFLNTKFLNKHLLLKQETKEGKRDNYLKVKTEEKSENFKQIRIKQDIFFGEIPLMTEEGTFIINGCERIVISQIIRSPGIYFRKEFALSSKKKVHYTATLISNKGLWTKFIFDVQKEKDGQKEKTKKKKISKESAREFERMYIQLSNFKGQENESEEKISEKEDLSKKLFLDDLLKYFGLNIYEILGSLKYPSKYIDAVFRYKKYLKIEKKNKLLNDDIILENVQKFFISRIGAFSIGEIGRYKINKKLGLNLPKEIDYLTIHDLFKIIDGLIELKYYDRINDDIDDIKNKLIRCVGDLLQNQLRSSLYRLQKSLENPFDENSKKFHFDSSLLKNQSLFDSSKNENFESLLDSEEWILDPRPLTNSLKDFFITSQLSQYMDQINPLAELTHKRRISVFGPNGLKRDHISNLIRDIHPSQYGRLCPIETPEGQNAGLINAISMYGRISSLGTIETPYFLMEQGKIFSKKSPIFLNPEQESNTKVAFCDVSMDKLKEIFPK